MTVAYFQIHWWVYHVVRVQQRKENNCGSLILAAFYPSIGGNQGFLIHCKLSVSVSHMMLGHTQI